MKLHAKVAAALFLTAVLGHLGCSPASSIAGSQLPASDTASGAAGSTTTSSLPAIYTKFRSTVQVSQSGSSVVLLTDDIPDHKSPYFGVGNAQYIAPQAGMVVNPNRIRAQSIELRVPASPKLAATATTAPLGAIGIAVNGVVLFNPYAAGFSPLDSEIPSFDQYNGHPQQQGAYHYHIEPVSITAANPSALVGVLLDGFPVYGPREPDGSAPRGLDSCNGHVGVTADDPAGIYHYHVTKGFPYISGCFSGVPGSVTN